MKRCCFSLSTDTITRITRIKDHPDKKRSGIVTDAVALLDEARAAVMAGGCVKIFMPDGTVKIPILSSLGPKPAA